MAIDTGKLEEFPGRFITDLGGTVAAGSVVIRHRPGLYQARAAGPVTAGELAAAPAPVPATSPDGCAGSADRCVEYDPAAGAFSMTEAYRRPSPAAL